MEEPMQGDATPTAPEASPVPPPPTTQPHKSFLWLAVGAIVLLLVVIGLLLVLLTQKTAAPAPQPAKKVTSTATSAANDINPRPNEKVVATLPSKQSGITVLIYQPRRTSSNLTIDFSLQNSCKTSCQHSVFTSLDSALDFAVQYPQAVTYLLDATSGAKYSPVLNSDGSIETCPTGIAGGYLKPGAQLNCYYAFTGVPAGATVSFLSGAFRADTITTP